MAQASKFCVEEVKLANVSDTLMVELNTN